MDDATKQDIRRLDEINKARMDDRAEVWNALAAASGNSWRRWLSRYHRSDALVNSRVVENFGVLREGMFVGIRVAIIEACAGVASPIHVAIRRLAPGPWCVIALCQEQRFMDGSIKFVLHQEEIGLTPEDTKEERTAKIQAATFLGLVRLRRTTED